MNQVGSGKKTDQQGGEPPMKTSLLGRKDSNLRSPDPESNQQKVGVSTAQEVTTGGEQARPTHLVVAQINKAEGEVTAEQAESPCDCDFHRGMTPDQAWSTLP